MVVLVSFIYGDYLLFCWEIINILMGLFIIDRIFKVDLICGGGDELVIIKVIDGC